MIWEGLYFTDTGYGEAARRCALALVDLGAEVTARPLDSQDDRCRVQPEELEQIARLVQRQPEPGELRVQHIQPPRFSRAKGACANVGCTMFETDRVPRDWIAPCNAMDEIWLPSKFCATSFARAGVRTAAIRVIPYGADLARFGPHVKPLVIHGARGYVFLSIFHWSMRKGWDVLLRAYLSEFKSDEEVCLVIRAPRLDYQELTQFVTDEFGSRARAPILLLPFALPDALLPSLYAAADAFVLPSRGEGWGLPYSEAMATGLPTIGTNWGGQLEFMTEGNSYLIAVDRLVPIDEWMQRVTGAEPDHRWAEPSVDHLRQVMRYLFQHPNEGKRKGQAARAYLGQDLTWRHTALKILERAEALGGLHWRSDGLAGQSVEAKLEPLGDADGA